MPSLNYYEIQKAIYEKLAGNSPLMAIISGVFDNVPQNTAYPFISLGDWGSSDLSDVGNNKIDYVLNLDVWSREKGCKQAVQIMDMIYDLLNNGNIMVTGKVVVSMRVSTTATQLENDGVTYHGKMRVRVILSS